jgi:hypothetical protein
MQKGNFVLTIDLYQVVVGDLNPRSDGKIFNSICSGVQMMHIPLGLILIQDFSIKVFCLFAV